MGPSKQTNRRRPTSAGPSVASVVRPPGRGRAYLSAPDLPPGVHDDFLKKCRFVQSLLVAQRIPECSNDEAAAWALAFADEGDPTFPIIDWLDSGWRDPLLVHAALRICGTREQAEACMDRIERDLGSRYEHGLILELAAAMLHPGRAANDL